MFISKYVLIGFICKYKSKDTFTVCTLQVFYKVFLTSPNKLHNHDQRCFKPNSVDIVKQNHPFHAIIERIQGKVK